MSDIPDHDSRAREERVGEYTICAASEIGRVTCYRPGMVLLDFYRTSPILVKDLPPTPQPKETK